MEKLNSDQGIIVIMKEVREPEVDAASNIEASNIEATTEPTTQAFQLKSSPATFSPSAHSDEQTINEDGGMPPQSFGDADIEQFTPSGCSTTRIWSPEESGYLLTLYDDNIHEFKDPNIRKNGIWSDFANAINKKFETNFTSTQVNQKFRNFKYEFEKAYIRGRKTAFHFDKLLRIFAEKLPDKKTVNLSQFESHEYQTAEMPVVHPVQMVNDNAENSQRHIPESSWAAQETKHIPTPIIYQMGKMAECSGCHPPVGTLPMSVHNIHPCVHRDDVPNDTRPRIQIVPIGQETDYCCAVQQPSRELQNSHAVEDPPPSRFIPANTSSMRLPGPTHVYNHYSSSSVPDRKSSIPTHFTSTSTTAKTKDASQKTDSHGGASFVHSDSSEENYPINGHISNSFESRTVDIKPLTGARKRKATEPSPSPSNPLKKLMNLLPTRTAETSAEEPETNYISNIPNKTHRARHITSTDNSGNVSDIVRVLDEWKDQSAKRSEERERREEKRHQESMAVANRLLELFQTFIDKLGSS